ncbi:MAG: MBL fold metallo-hydrolase [Rhizobacter sp.]|nr:MBL fold metallo-hydrolase [Ferruginibacter sp.]
MIKRTTIFVLQFSFLLQANAQQSLSKNMRGSNPLKTAGMNFKPTAATNENADSIAVRITKAAGNVYFLDCINGFGGGNVAASVGEDGILLVDDMYSSMSAKIESSLRTISPKPVKIILNTHFHRDHIGGNEAFNTSAVIVGHENIGKRLIQNNNESDPTIALLPKVTFADSLVINFNGEAIQMIHFANSHTDGDAMIYFTKSKVLHLGDMFFFEMFPAVYAEGGGNIKQLVTSLEKIITRIPPDAIIVPGHGKLATMQDLKTYVVMLKETITIIETKIKEGQTLVQVQNEKVLAKYDQLGNGGAQTTAQYTAMLYKLLSTNK